jgi:hypothetical protein
MTTFDPTAQQIAYAASISRQVAAGTTTWREATIHLTVRYGVTMGQASVLLVHGGAERAARPQAKPAGPRTLESEDRGEVAAALLGHLQDDEYVTELLDLAGLEGDAQSAWVRVAFDGVTWFADLFPVREAA